jgi:hypothetical protein
MTGKTEQSDLDPRTGWFFVLFLGTLGVLFADGILTKAVRPVETIERTGTLVGATGSKGRFGNNTTLIIENSSGNLERFEVKSSIKVREVSRIRAKARSLIGEEVIYTISTPFEELLAVRTRDGGAIVTRQHILESEQFTGWAGAIGGFALMLICVVRIAQLGQRKT